MNKKILLLVSIFLLASAISACTSQEVPPPEENRDQQVTFAVQTVYAQIEQTRAAEAAMATPTPIPTNTPLPTLTPTLEPSPTPTNVFVETPTVAAQDTGSGNVAAPQPTQPPSTSSSDMPCLKANLEYESVPDGTEFALHQEFTKVWRIKNIGNCTWNKDYILRFYEGDLLDAEASVVLTDVDIPTWGYANIEVPMRAPDKEGTYIGYWKIISDTGKIFGVGPNGNGWIWVEIKAVDK